MRRPGDFSDSGANAYIGSQMQHMSDQKAEHDSGVFQGQLEAFTPERDDPYITSNAEGNWRWERDEPKMSNSVQPQIFNEGHRNDALRSLYHDQRPDPKLVPDKSGNSDVRPRLREGDMQTSYEGKFSPCTFEGLEHSFFDDFAKLVKEQNDAEDAEYSRHREKINAINGEHQEQLIALRAQYASHRCEFLRKEANSRQHQYQQVTRDQNMDKGMGLSSDPRGRSGFASTPNSEPHRVFNNADQYNSNRERACFLGGERRGSYASSRVYDSTSPYY